MYLSDFIISLIANYILYLGTREILLEADICVVFALGQGARDQGRKERKEKKKGRKERKGRKGRKAQMFLNW